MKTYSRILREMRAVEELLVTKPPSADPRDIAVVAAIYNTLCWMLGIRGKTPMELARKAMADLQRNLAHEQSKTAARNGD